MVGRDGLVLKVSIIHKIGDFIIVGIIGSGSRGISDLRYILSCETGSTELIHEGLHLGHVVCAQLIDDAWKHFLKGLGDGSTGDDVRIGGDLSLNLWVLKVDHGAIVLKNVDLLDAGELTELETLEGGLETLIVGGSGLVNGLLLSSDGALSANAYASGHALQLCKLLLIDCAFHGRGRGGCDIYGGTVSIIEI